MPLKHSGCSSPRREPRSRGEVAGCAAVSALAFCTNPPRNPLNRPVLLLAGLHDGRVCIWGLSEDVPATSTLDASSQSEALFVVYAHANAVRFLTTAQDWFLTIGTDGLKLWRLEEPNNPTLVANAWTEILTELNKTVGTNEDVLEHQDIVVTVPVNAARGKLLTLERSKSSIKVVSAAGLNKYVTGINVMPGHILKDVEIGAEMKQAFLSTLKASESLDLSVLPSGEMKLTFQAEQAGAEDTQEKAQGEQAGADHEATKSGKGSARKAASDLETWDYRPLRERGELVVKASNIIEHATVGTGLPGVFHLNAAQKGKEAVHLGTKSSRVCTLQ